MGRKEGKWGVKVVRWGGKVVQLGEEEGAVGREGGRVGVSHVVVVTWEPGGGVTLTGCRGGMQGCACASVSGDAMR